MPKEKFCKGFVSFTNEAFPNHNIWFVLYGPERTGYISPKANNVIFVEDIEDVCTNETSIKLLMESKLIILNWVNWRLAAQLYQFHRKTLYLFWGGEIYGAISQKPWSLQRLYKAALLRSAGSIATLIPGDLSKIEQLSKKHGKWYLSSIFDLADLENDDSAVYGLQYRRRSKGPIRVLLGNSATPSNRHIEAFRILASFKDSGIEVLVPLSYGEDAYRAEVIKQGRSFLGDAFVPILGFMDRSQYVNLLASVSIGVFNQDRQQGMGNISILMMQGAKVYISQSSPMWDDFKEEGRVVYPIESISCMTFEEFAAYSEEEAAINHELLKPSTRYNNALARWSVIYSDYCA